MECLVIKQVLSRVFVYRASLKWSVCLQSKSYVEHLFTEQVLSGVFGYKASLK